MRDPERGTAEELRDEQRDATQDAEAIARAPSIVVSSEYGRTSG